MSDNYISLDEAVTRVFRVSKDSRDLDPMLISDFVEAMVSMDKVRNGDTTYTLTKQGFQQLTALMKAPLASFNDRRLPFRTKHQILGDIASGPDGKKEVVVRTLKNTKSGQYEIDSIVSSSYSFFDNDSLGASLLDLRKENIIPEQARVMSLNVQPRSLDIRLVFPDWSFIVKEGDSEQSFLSNVVINNNETGKGALGVRVAITRHSCLNSTIGSSLTEVNHKWATYDEFLAALTGGFNHVNRYAEEMINHMRGFQNISTSSPMLIFSKVGEELGIPKYAMSGVEKYWTDHGSGDSLYDVTQALSRGIQEVTTEAGRRKADWGKRALLESRIWDMSLMFQNMEQEGVGIDHYLTCKSCHQMLPEPKTLVMN